MVTVQSPPTKVLFPLLKDPPTYSPCTFDYLSKSLDANSSLPSLSTWIQVFRGSIPQYRKMALADEHVPEDKRQAAAQRFCEKYEQILQTLEADPAAELPGFAAAPLDCKRLTALRETCYRREGFVNAFQDLKAEEEAKALKLLPGVLRALDDIADRRQRLEQAVRGVFSGNIFDLGAAASTELFNSKGISFNETRDQLVERPWVLDDLDALLDRLTSHHYRKAIIFVDNAGSDVLLGILPFARELVRAGTAVVLAANAVPAINDVTAAELSAALKVAAGMDQQLGRAVAEQTLTVVSSGSDLPVIDLREVSEEVAEMAADADLVVLEGMGRSIETNLYAEFTVDSLRMGMIKHQEVAACLQGRLYDCVCKFDVV